MKAARRTTGTWLSCPRRRSRAMKLTSPTYAPRLEPDSTIRNSEIAVKNAPATGLLKCLVITTVTARLVTAATPAPTRFSVLPRATSASRCCPRRVLVTGAAVVIGLLAPGAVPGRSARAWRKRAW